MANRGLVKSYAAGAAISPCHFVKFGTSDYTVVTTAAVSDAIIGISVPLVSAALGDPVDIIQQDIADLTLGGTVTRGDLLTSDANGCGVTAAPAAGVNNRTGAIALISGVSGDVIPVQLAQGSVQG